MTVIERDTIPLSKTDTEKMQQIYAMIPKIDCQKKCAESCGPVDCSQEELRIIHKFAKDHKIPFYTFQKITVKKAFKDLMDDKCKMCPYLKNDQCSIYDVRPIICRLWGVVEDMPCIFGCKPERMLSRIEGQKLIDEARALLMWR